MGYLTFEEYQKLGGKCTQDIFPNLQFDVESKMNFITFNKLSKLINDLGNVPDEVKMLEAKLINIEFNVNPERDTSVSSYSNGIETFSYSSNEDDVEKLLNTKVRQLMMEYLYPKYPDLFYRGRWVERARYNNTSE